MFSSKNVFSNNPKNHELLSNSSGLEHNREYPTNKFNQIFNVFCLLRDNNKNDALQHLMQQLDEIIQQLTNSQEQTVNNKKDELRCLIFKMWKITFDDIQNNKKITDKDNIWENMLFHYWLKTL